MTALQNKKSLRFRIIASLAILMALLIFINIRIDLVPNSVIVNVQPTEAYLSPEIYINTGNGYESTSFSSGQIFPVLSNDLIGFRIEFQQQPYFTGDDLTFFDHLTDGEIQTSKWVAFLNPFEIDPENVKSIIFTPLDPEAVYEVHIDDVGYPLKETDGVLSVDNLDFQRDLANICIPQRT